MNKVSNIVSTKIISAKYGVGTITAISDTLVLTVSFPKVGEKRFQYPDAFCKSIQSADAEMQENAETAWLLKLEEKKANEAADISIKCENNRRLKKISPDEIEIKKAELSKILEHIEKDIEFTGWTNRIFIVHQGKTYYEERMGEYVWAPASGLHHHERMTEIRKGDIVVNYANGAIQAVSEALSDCFCSPRPTELYGYGWDNIGYRVQLRYYELLNPIKLDPIRHDIIKLKADVYSSFDSTGNACQGYMYELENEIAKLIKDLILKEPHMPEITKVLGRF